MVTRAVRRSVSFLLVAALMAVVGTLTAPPPVFACSCAATDSLRDFADAEHAVFTGSPGVRQARGVPVTVDRWFWGVGAAPTVWLADENFPHPNVSSSCEIQAPAPGSRWLWVGWLPGNAGTIDVGLCSPAGDLSTEAGQQLLAEATKIFPEVAIPPPVAAPTAAPPDTTEPTPDQATAAREGAWMWITAALVAGSLALFGVLVLIARRSRARS
jgi:hypothetical protein